MTFLEVGRTAGVALWLGQEKLDTEVNDGLLLLDVAAMLAHHVRQGHHDRILRGQAAARNLDEASGR